MYVSLHRPTAAVIYSHQQQQTGLVDRRGDAWVEVGSPASTQSGRLELLNPAERRATDKGRTGRRRTEAETVKDSGNPLIQSL